MNPTNEVPCAICGADHDPETTPEIDSTHLCPTCADAERAYRDLRPPPRRLNDRAT